LTLADGVDFGEAGVKVEDLDVAVVGAGRMAKLLIQVLSLSPHTGLFVML
jgi:hypothetical protein